MKLKEHADTVLEWAFILMFPLILGMYIGATQQEHRMTKKMEVAAKEASVKCEKRITNVLLQLEVKFNGLEFFTADGDITIYPRRVKTKAGEYDGNPY